MKNKINFISVPNI